MGSPSGYKKFGKYTGTGSATAQDFVTSFEPKSVKIYSVEGTIVWNERMPGPRKDVDGAAPSFLGASALSVLKDKGFTIASADDAINKSGVDYYYEAE